MKDLLIDVYELLSVMIPFFIAFTFLSKKQKNLPHFLLALIFALYILAVYHLTNTGTLYDLLRNDLTYTSEFANYIPFSMTIDSVGYIQNILLFIPFGMLCPLFAKKSYGIIYVITGFLFSFLIECSQLLNNRSSDVDDLIMNTLGAIIGYIIYKLILERFIGKGKIKCITAFEPLIYILIMITGRFLLFNEYSLAKFLYGF